MADFTALLAALFSVTDIRSVRLDNLLSLIPSCRIRLMQARMVSYSRDVRRASERQVVLRVISR